MQTQYGDISPRTAGYVAAELLKRGIPYLLIEKFGQGKPVPMNSTKSIIFRRYEALSNTPSALSEGVTPTAKKLTKTDITATLTQYGDLVEISDVVADTHEDPVLTEAVEILSEQAAQVIEIVRYGIIKAGTNVFYSNGSARNAVNTPVSLSMQRRITRALKRQNARKITSVIRSTPSFGTQNVAPGFVAICSSDCEGDIRNMPGFQPAETYGPMHESEIGKVEDCRYFGSSLLTPFADAGGSAGTMLSTTGSNADVYPILYIARDAYGIVPLKGKAAITPSVVNPKPSAGDPLGQRGYAGWKSMQTAVILNDLWMARGEVAVSTNP